MYTVQHRNGSYIVLVQYSKVGMQCNNIVLYYGTVWESNKLTIKYIKKYKCSIAE